MIIPNLKLSKKTLLFVWFLFRIFFLKRILTWWYHRKVRKNETHLAKLEEERTKILEDVMDTETYKVAKEILDKYGPVQQITKPTKVHYHSGKIPDICDLYPSFTMLIYQYLY